MTIVKYRPTRGSINSFDQLVNEFFGRDIGQFFGNDDVRGSHPGVNIVERDNEFVLKMLAPGFSKQDLKLNVENDVLTISAEKKSEDLKEGERYTRREFTHSSFARSFHLPEGVEADHIKAEFTDGVLAVMTPKTDRTRAKAKEINIQ